MVLYFLQQAIQPYQFRDVPDLIYALIIECLGKTSYSREKPSEIISKSLISYVRNRSYIAFSDIKLPFTSFPVKYQNWFIASALQAMNDFSKYLDFKKFVKYFELDVENKMSEERTLKLQKKFLKNFKEVSLEKAQKKNEKSKIRCVAMVVETRPDYCSEKEIKRMLDQGVTRVEVGVQSIYDDVLKKLLHKELLVQDKKKIKLSDKFIFSQLSKNACFERIQFKEINFHSKLEPKISIDNIKELITKFCNIKDHRECYIVKYDVHY